MVHIKRINEMTDFMNEGLLSAIKARAQIVKVQGWFFDTAAQVIADNPKRYRKAEQLVDALESDARKEYKKVVTVEDALTFSDWWGDFRKSAINALERNFEQSMNESASPYDSGAEGKRIWDAIIGGRENTLPRTSREDACKCLATYFSNFNEFNAPSAEDISRLVNWLETTYSNTDAQNEEGVARFISSLWRHFSYKGRAFSNIIRNYQSMHPTSSLGERIALGRKFDR